MTINASKIKDMVTSFCIDVLHVETINVMYFDTGYPFYTSAPPPGIYQDTIETTQRGFWVHLPWLSYSDLLKRTNLPIVAERRCKTSKEYFNKIQRNDQNLNPLLQN